MTVSAALIHLAEGLSLPLDAATQTFGFIAKKRAGKSYAAGVLLEGFAKAGVQFGVLDPVGRHYGLRLAADGKSKGIDVVILGGLRGDIPLDPNSGKLVADAFCDTGRSFIFDVSQFSLGERKRFVTAFGEQLWLRQKALRDPRPMHIVLEEAQLFLPQQMIPGEDARMVGIWTEIVRLGGNVGIGVSLITQRPQSVSKEALTQVECLVVLQVNGVPEKKSLKEWMVEKGGELNLLDELPFLKQGIAYIWSPTWLEHFGKHAINKKWTFDASATPKVGAKRVQADLPPLDLGLLKTQMEAAVKKGEENDPVVLKKRIAELTKAVAQQPVPAEAKPQLVEVKQVKVALQADITRLLKGIEGLDHIQAKFDVASLSIRNEVRELTEAISAAKVVEKPETLTLATQDRKLDAFKLKPVSIESVARGPDRVFRPPGDGEVKLKAGARKMLHALAQFDPKPLSRHQLGSLVGLPSTKTTFSAYLSTLFGAGLIGKQGDDVCLTEAGKSEAGGGEFSNLTHENLMAIWLPRFKMGARRMLEELVRHYPKAITREFLGGVIDLPHDKTTFSAYLSTLTTNGLVVKHGDQLSASPTLFPE